MASLSARNMDPAGQKIVMLGSHFLWLLGNPNK